MITNAAILINGRVWTGRRHHEIIADICKTTVERPVRGVQGFVTESGDFVTREEARDIVIECGQVKKTSHHRMLFSEDLW